MQNTSAPNHPLDVLQRIDAARPKFISSLNELNLSHNGPEAREQLAKCISTTSNVTETLRHVTPIPEEVTRLITELAELLEKPPTSIKKITSWLDRKDAKAVQRLDDLRGHVQGVLNKLRVYLPSSDVLNIVPESSTGEGGTESEIITASTSRREDDSPLKSLKWKMTLEPSKKILDAVSKAAPLIPIVGPFIQCGVESISTLIGMIQGMTDNDGDAQRLCEKVKQLTDMMATFQDERRQYSSKGALVEYLQSLKEHCEAVKKGAQKILKQRAGRKVVFSVGNARDLVDLEKHIDAAVNKLELYLGLDVHRMVEHHERDRLINLLGNANYGKVGYLKEDGLCLDGTRVKILQKVDDWADDLSSPTALLLRGQAGRGKSTIAKTVASRFQKRWGNKASCAIFHFRHNDKLNQRPLLALARQLARHAEQQVRTALLQAVKDHEDVAYETLQDQFDILFIAPLNQLESYPPRVLFIIDALDECGDPALVSALLKLIAAGCPSLPSTIKFLFTSRPENHVVGGFQAFQETGTDENLDTIDSADIDHDLRAYFLEHLCQIRKAHLLGDLWPTENTVDRLVVLSEGLFQWADAAMRYVKEAPKLNLPKLIDFQDVVVGLPSLYRRILLNALPSDPDVTDTERPKLLEYVLGSLAVASRPISPAALAYLWNESADIEGVAKSTSEVFNVLNPLRSMLRLPNEDTPESPVHFMHMSVRDFLIHNKFQCGDSRLSINPTAQHSRLVSICFDRMKRDLKYDICNVNDSSKMNTEILDLVALHIPSGLRYCCRSWSTHLSEIEDDGNATFNDIQKQVTEFCTERLLHWLEVLSLIGALSEVFDMTRQTRDWLKVRCRGKGSWIRAGAVTSQGVLDRSWTVRYGQRARDMVVDGVQDRFWTGDGHLQIG